MPLHSLSLIQQTGPLPGGNTRWGELVPTHTTHTVTGRRSAVLLFPAVADQNLRQYYPCTDEKFLSPHHQYSQDPFHSTHTPVTGRIPRMPPHPLVCFSLKVTYSRKATLTALLLIRHPGPPCPSSSTHSRNQSIVIAVSILVFPAKSFTKTWPFKFHFIIHIIFFLNILLWKCIMAEPLFRKQKLKT